MMKYIPGKDDNTSVESAIFLPILFQTVYIMILSSAKKPHLLTEFAENPYQSALNQLSIGVFK